MDHARPPTHEIVMAQIHGPARTDLGKPMKPPIKRLSDLKPATQAEVYARATPKASRRKTAKVLTPAEKAAFLASRPDLAGKS